MTRLAVARLWFCSNSFTPRRTRGEDLHFHGQAPLAGQALSPDTTDTEMAGVRQFAAAHPGWDVTLLRCASAPPGGPLSAEAFGTWMADVEEGLRRGRFDAVYLSLHGACQAEGDPVADLTILRRVRTIIGHTPLVASFDVKANLSEEVVILLDGATCNDIWPSGGGARAALRALELLGGILSGQSRPVGALARVPFVLPDLLMGDTITDLWSRRLRSLPAPLLEANVFSGFAWGDSPFTGPSALVWADRDAGAAREMAALLAVDLARARSRSRQHLVLPEDAMAVSASGGSRSKPCLLLDLGDDPLLGGLADTTSLLAAMLARQGSARSLFAAFFDPGAVVAALASGVGGTIERTIGGQFCELYGKGMLVSATVMALGVSGESGRYAIVRVGAVDIVLTETRPPCITPAWLAERGIDIDGFARIAVKGGAIARMAFSAVVGLTILCDTPGPTSQNLLRLRFHYVPAARRANGQEAKPASEPEFEAGRGQPAPVAHPRLDQPGTDQCYQRHEDRRTNAQQKRPEALGT